MKHLKNIITAELLESIYNKTIAKAEINEALPNWAADVFDKEGGKKVNKRVDPSKHDLESGGKTDVVKGEKRKAETQRYELLKQATKTVSGRHGMNYDADKEEIITHKHEHPAGEPEDTPQHAEPVKGDGGKAAADVFGMGRKQTAAQAKAEHDAPPARPRGAGATAAAMADYRVKLRAHQAKMAKNESYIFDGAEFNLCEQVSEEDEMDNIKLNIVKEGHIYNYALSFNGDILKEGIGVTPFGIINECNRFMESLTEQVMCDKNKTENVKKIIKKYTV